MRYGNPSKKPRVIASVRGHAIEFPGRGSVPKDAKPPEGAVVDDIGTVYVFVPVTMEAEVAAAGMVPESEIEEQDERAKPLKPEDQGKLKKDVYDALDVLVAAGEREAFGANGQPKPAALEKLLGYAVNNAELKEFWRTYQIDKTEGHAT